MRRTYREFLSFECEGVSVLMTHIGGYPRHYTPQAVARIQSLRPKIFIAGHSHILKVIYDPVYDLLHLNPGAAGCLRFPQGAQRPALHHRRHRHPRHGIGEWPRPGA